MTACKYAEVLERLIGSPSWSIKVAAISQEI